MSPGAAGPPPAAPARRRRVVAAILVCGWTLAAVAYLTAAPAVRDDEVYEMEHSRRATRELERVGGKSAVLASELNDAVAALWAGRTRAATIAVLTAAAAGAYVLLARAARPERPGGDAP